MRLKDVARVELGSREYNFSAARNGKPTVPIGIFLQPGANALEVGNAVKARMAELAKPFPAGLDWSIPYDTTVYVRVSIIEVVKTLAEAMLLVFAVVFLFLQNWRATLIPMLAVPVSLIGTFAAMLLLGFSINTLTLFGMVLADRHRGGRRHRGARERRAASWRARTSSPRDATVKAMDAGDAAGDRHRVRAHRGVPAGRVPRRPGRRDVPPVRHHHRGVGGHLGLRRAHVDAGAVRRRAAPRGCREPRLAAQVRGLVRAHDRALRPRRGVHAAPRRPDARAVRRDDRRDRRSGAQRARGTGAGRGPGLRDGDPDPAGRRVAQAHGGGERAAHGSAARAPGGGPGDDLLRSRRAHVQPAHEHRHHLGEPQGLERARRQRAVGEGRRGLRVRRRLADQGCVRAGVRAAADRGPQHDRRLRRLRAVASRAATTRRSRPRCRNWWPPPASARSWPA